MKPYFIKDDDGNYLNAEYIYQIDRVRYSRLGSILIFVSIKRPKSGGDHNTTKYLEGDFEVLEWIDNFTQIFLNFVKFSNGYECVNQNLIAFEMSDLINTETHTSLDVDKISHINAIYENYIFQHFEIVYIDSDQVVMKEFDTEELAKIWIAEHFEVI